MWQRRLVGALVLLLCLCGPAAAKYSSPKVQLYSRALVDYGKNNTLICHVSGFHPPEISVKLLKDEQEIPNSQQTDLAFEESWQYHLTTHAPFTPKKGDKYTCRVIHLDHTNTYIWDPDM